MKTNEGTLSAIFNLKRVRGYEIGIESFDILTGGFRAGTCIIFAAATGMGKSLISINFALKLAKQTKVCYVDLENGEVDSLARMVQIDNKLKTNFFEKESNSKKFLTMLEKIENICYLDTDSFSPELQEPGKKDNSSLLDRILKKFESLKDQGYEIFFLDPLKDLERENKAQNVLIEQGEIITRLKNFAVKNKVVVLINHHIRKSQSNVKSVKNIDEVPEETYRMPNLDEIRGSSMITDTATDVWAFMRKKDDNNSVQAGKILFRVLKSRFKQSGSCRMFINLEDLNIYESYLVPFPDYVEPSFDPYAT